MSSTEEPTASVVVCAYNEAALIESCLRGVVLQTFPADRFDILVVDDGSEDETYEIVERFVRTLPPSAPRLRLIRKKHGGLSEARNLGIQMTGGDIAAFVDADAVPDAHWLENIVSAFANGADYVGGRIDLLNKGSWVARLLQHSRHRQFFGPRVFNDQFIGANMAVRRSVFECEGGFVENFVSRGDDSTLHERLAGRYRYASAPDAVVLHERPESFATYLSIEWKSALLSHPVQRILGKRMQWRIVFLRVEQTLILLIPIAAILVVAAPHLFTIPFALTVTAAARRFFFRPLARHTAKGLVQEFGWIRGMAGHLLIGITVNAVQIAGAIVSRFRHRDFSAIEPMTTKAVITRSMDTHPDVNPVGAPQVRDLEAS